MAHYIKSNSKKQTTIESFFPTNFKCCCKAPINPEQITSSALSDAFFGQFNIRKEDQKTEKYDN